MQKLLDFIRNNIIGRSFLYVFISNFFCIQCLGMLHIEQPLPRSVCQERQLFLYNKPNATVALEFIQDDFSLSFNIGDTTETFSTQNTQFIDGLYHLNFSNEVEIAVDIATRKIFCHKFLWDESVFFSAFGSSLIVNELVCGGLARLAADNICISGMLSSSSGLTLTGQGAVENLGVIDSPYATIKSDTFTNSGRINGKIIDLEAQNSAKFGHGSSVLATGKIILKSQETALDQSSFISKKVEVNSEEFEMTSSSVSARDSFLFRGQQFRINDQSELWAESDISIYSGSFFNKYSNIESNGLLNLILSNKFISLLNLNARISALNLSISANGNIHNVTGTIEAMQNMELHGSIITNEKESLLEGGRVCIDARNVINRKSIIRSLLGNENFKLGMKKDHFISNAYAHTTSQVASFRTEEDEFNSRRNANIYFNYHKPKETTESGTTKEQTTSGSTETDGEKKKDIGDVPSGAESENEDVGEENSTGEIGSLLNYSGEIISAGSINVSGSGSLYNVSDSIIKANNDFSANVFGRILNKHRSNIKVGAKVEAKAKIGLIYFENSTLKSGGDSVFSSGDKVAFDEASLITGCGTLNILSETLVNRGLIKRNGSIGVKCGHLDNSGTIKSKADVSIESLESFRETDKIKRGFSNKGGIIKAASKVSFLSPTICIGGDITSETLLYKYYNPSSEKEYDFENIANLICNSATYDFGAGNIKVRSPLELYAATTFIGERFYNGAIIKAHAPLTIKGQEIQNGYEHNLKGNIRRFNGYNLAKHEWEFQNDTNLSGSVDNDDFLYIRPEAYTCAVAILGEDSLDFQVTDLFYNSATIESRKNIRLTGSRIQTGWATWNEKTIQLPFVEGAQYRGYRCHDGVFDFPYDFYSPQRSLIRAYGDMEIFNCNKFISSFGNIQVSGKLQAHTSGLFLNYAGNMRIGSGAEIRAEKFVNTIGTMATSEQGLRYWKIAAATTDPASIICTGALDIFVEKYFKNKASHLYATGNMHLNGKDASGLLMAFDPKFVNESSGTEYHRMYTISGVSVSKSSRHVCGVRCGSRTTTYWWQDINEIVQDSVIRAAISGAQEVALSGFKGARNTGVIAANSLRIENIGDLGFSHGDSSRLQFKPSSPFKKQLSIEPTINRASLFADYLFLNPVTDEMKIPFAIIDDGSVEPAAMAEIDPAMSMQEYAGFMYREMMRAYPTASLNDIITFEKGAELAFNNSKDVGTPIAPPTLFAKAMTSAVLVKPEHIKSGIYFRPHKYTDKYYGKITLFPELYLSDDSISSILRNPYGTLHTRGDIDIQTSGPATFSASMHSGGHTNISAKSAKFETQTFDRDVVTQRTFESASGGSLYGSKTREIKTQWEKLTIARDPVIISTGKGLGICLQKGQTAEFKGVVAHIGGDLKIEKGNFKLTPLMVTEVSVNEEGSYVIAH